MRQLPLFRSTLVTLVLFSLPPAHAAWVENGNVVSARPDPPGFSAAVPDGAGGAIVVWIEQSSDQDLLAQRVDADGNPLWAPNGVVVCDATGQQWTPSIISDGAGGAIIAWEDDRFGFSNTDIYVQRVDASGTMLWANNGVVICNAGGKQQRPRMDSTGGTIIMSWQDARSGGYDVYVQRLGADGSTFWTTNGVPLCTAGGDQEEPYLVSDGSGGAVVTWRDERNATVDVYARAVNFLGNPVWTVNGVAVVTATGTQSSPRIVRDDGSGVIITWDDQRGVDRDIYAQRLSPAGTPLWTIDGVVVCDASLHQSFPLVISDGAGGAIIAWTDNRTDYDVYAQRLTGLGVTLWAYQGVPVAAATGWQVNPHILGDGDGGVVVMWHDQRYESVGDLFIQRIRSNGAPSWATNGVPVVLGNGGQANGTFTSAGAAFLFWVDYRSGYGNFYAQRVELTHGWWGHPEPTILSAADNPGDQGGQVALDWLASGRDNLLDQDISHYSTWRAVDSASAAGAPAGEVAADDAGPRGRAVSLAEVGPGFSGSAHRDERGQASSGFLWEFVGTQDAIYASGYSDLVATRQDSTAADPAQHYFQVVAHTFAPSIFFPSAPDSGYSVDNLAPASPLMLAAQRSGPDVLLDWHGPEEPDLAEYAVYRGTAAGVQPEAAFFLDSSVDTVLTDANAPASELYYIVTALDVHGNESPSSNEAMVDADATGVGEGFALTSLQVRPNHPNPFGRATEIRLGLPAEREVTLEIYDVAGRRVFARAYGTMAAGWQQLRYDGRDEEGRALPAGVYFYRVSVGSESVARKMMITR